MRTQTIERKFTLTHLPQGELSELQLALKNAGVDIEHHKNVVNALDAKLAAFEDLQNDVHQNIKAFKESEGARAKLRIEITTTAEKLKQDTQDKEQFHQTLKENIKNLQDQI